MKEHPMRIAFWSLLVALLIAMPVSAQQTGGSALDQIKARGTLLAGVRADNPPMGFYDKSGQLAGFGVDIATEVARELGVKVSFVPVTSETRAHILSSGQVDAVFDSTTPTVDREQAFDFSIIYNWDSVVPLVRAGDSLHITDYHPPKKASATQGNYTIALFKQAVPNGEIITFPAFPEAVVALLNHKVDAVIINRFAATAWAKQYAGKLAVGDSFFRDPQAIMLRENDSKWRKTLNFMLQKMWLDGTYQRLYVKDFGYKPPFPSIWTLWRLQPGIDKWQLPQ
jgi:polar amino acid transport system substrate-binding protein